MDIPATPPAPPLCWWCHAAADSREHRVKRTQLARLMGDHDHLIFESGGYSTRLNSVRSRPILFPKIMCQKCNNQRSAPFDKAYDIFIARVWEDAEFFREKKWFIWSDVFDSAPEVGDLCRYYIKNIACRIAEIGFDVPNELVAFLDGAEGMPHSAIVLYKDYSTYDQFKRVNLNGHYPVANRMHNPENPEDGPLLGFTAEVQDGPIGALFWWDAVSDHGVNFCSQAVVPLRRRRDLPYHDLHAHEWKRAEVMKRGIDSGAASDFGAN